MAQTDSRPAFRLPWAPDRSDSDQPTEDAATEVAVAQAPDSAEALVTSDITEATATPTVKRPTKFMAELSHAMQVAAASARDETMTRFVAEAKTVVEEIHAASTVEAAALRRRADDDVAAVREWSKTEIARIREEAEARIATRKLGLDGEMDAHGHVIEARVERVTATVADFETRMTTFFEHLLAEEDPTRIATMAETMPDPPDLAGVAASIAEPEVAPFDPVPTGHVSNSVPSPAALAAAEAAHTTQTSEAADAAQVSAAAAHTTETSEATEAAEVSAAAAAQVAATLAETDAAPDFAAAEAEAAAFTSELDDDDTPPAAEDIPATVAEAVSGPIAESGLTTSRVVVLGLVSVASIATFKRSLGRVPGISTISVASGPDGEFVFTVNHEAGFGLGGAITALPGFEARITGEHAGGLEVTAHDPDAGT